MIFIVFLVRLILFILSEFISGNSSTFFNNYDNALWCAMSDDDDTWNMFITTERLMHASDLPRPQIIAGSETSESINKQQNIGL